MAFARSKSHKFLGSDRHPPPRGIRIRRPSEVSLRSAPADARSEASRPPRGQAMYAGGRLSKLQRQRLYDIYQKQEKKSDLAVKYEAKFNEKLPKLYTTTKDGRWRRRTSPGSPSMRSSASTPSIRPRCSDRSFQSKQPTTESIAADEGDDEYGDVDMYAASDCSEPPRTKLVEEKRRGSGQLDWVSIIQYKQAIARADEQQEMKQRSSAKKELRRSLEQQIQERVRRKLEEEDSKLAEHDEESRKLQEWKREEKRNRELMLETRLKEKHIRLLQNEEMKASKMRRAERRRRRDLALLAAAKRECEAAKNEAIEKKINARKKMELMEMENKVQKELKRQEELRQEVLEGERQRRYIEDLDRKERERENFYAKTAQKQEMNMQALINNTAEATEAARKEDLRILADQRAYDLKREQEEERKKAENLKMKQEIAAELAWQVRNREAERQARIKEDETFRNYLIADSKLGEQREQREVKARRDKLLEQAKFLEKQMEEVQMRKKLEKVAMNDSELKLNGDLLRSIKKWEIAPSNVSGLRPRPY